MNVHEKSYHYEDEPGPRADLALGFTFLVVLGVLVLIMLR